MHSRSSGASSPSLVLNVEKLRELQRANMILTDTALAELVGVDSATLYRVLRGKTTPSNAFIARFKLAFPTVPLDALFHVNPEAVAS